MRRIVLAGVVAACSMLGMSAPESKKLPNYEPEKRVTGDLSSIGSDTMLNLMTSWGERFRTFHPSVRVQVEGKGSSTAPPALLEGQAQFGPMSRAMDKSEVARFVEEFGFEPVRLRVAIDCIAIFVHRDCPVDEITLDQIRDVFSVAGESMTWGDLGVEDSAWASRPIQLYGRNSASGTYKFFKSVALGDTDYKSSVKEVPGSSGVVQSVSVDPFSMGYSGVGYRTPDVKVLKVAFDDHEEAFAPDEEEAQSGDYPIARFLYVYAVKDPRKPLDDLRAEFTRFIYSAEGQEAVVKDGVYPVSREIAKQELRRVGLEPGF